MKGINYSTSIEQAWETYSRFSLGELVKLMSPGMGVYTQFLIKHLITYKNICNSNGIEPTLDGYRAYVGDQIFTGQQSITKSIGGKKKRRRTMRKKQYSRKRSRQTRRR
jgi:hypothetical protein